jgi:hypothetical protein
MQQDAVEVGSLAIRRLGCAVINRAVKDATNGSTYAVCISGIKFLRGELGDVDFWINLTGLNVVTKRKMCEIADESIGRALRLRKAEVDACADKARARTRRLPVVKAMPLIEYNGRKITVLEACKLTRCTYMTMYGRYRKNKGKSLEELAALPGHKNLKIIEFERQK